jgi:hypothetical protein
MLRLIVLLVLTALASGCASTASTLVNRPVVENTVDGAVSTVSLAADRRTVVVVTEGTNRSKFCAEPPPDTATGLKTELEASLEAKAKSDQAKAEVQGKGSVKESTVTTVTVIAERTAALDVFRTGVYALCQYYLNGAIAKEEVGPLFEKLIEAFASSESGKPKPVAVAPVKP